MMKKILTAFFALMLFTGSFSALMAATEINKNTATRVVQDANETKDQLYGNKELMAYVPADLFFDSMLELSNANTYLENREYNDAYYKALTAKNKFLTAKIRGEAAQIRLSTLKNQIGLLKAENDGFKNKMAGQAEQFGKELSDQAKVAILLTIGLKKEGKNYSCMKFDKEFFDKPADIVLSSSGKNQFQNFYNLMNAFPESVLIIESFNTSKKMDKITQKKVESLIQFLTIQNDIDKTRVEFLDRGQDTDLKTNRFVFTFKGINK